MICGYFLKEITDSNFAAIYSAVIFAASYYFLTYKHISEKPFKAADPAALFFLQLSILYFFHHSRIK